MKITTKSTFAGAGAGQRLGKLFQLLSIRSYCAGETPYAEMYEAQCEDPVRLPDSATEAWPAAHDQVLLEGNAKHAISAGRYCSLALIRSYLTVGAFSTRARFVLCWPSVPSGTRQVAYLTVSAVFSIKCSPRSHCYGTSVPRSAQEIPCRASLKGPWLFPGDYLRRPPDGNTTHGADQVH